jgi:ketosteroid isomerase-like protein
MTEAANLASMARGMLEAWNRGDVEGVASTYANDGIMRIAGHNAISGTFRGRDAFLAQLGRIGQMGVVRIEEIETILASDQHVMVFLRAVCERNDKRLDAVFVFAYKVGPDGRWSELWFLPDNQAGFDDVWS